MISTTKIVLIIDIVMDTYLVQIVVQCPQTIVIQVDDDEEVMYPKIVVQNEIIHLVIMTTFVELHLMLQPHEKSKHDK